MRSAKVYDQMKWKRYVPMSSQHVMLQMNALHGVQSTIPILVWLSYIHGKQKKQSATSPARIPESKSLLGHPGWSKLLFSSGLRLWTTSQNHFTGALLLVKPSWPLCRTSVLQVKHISQTHQKNKTNTSKHIKCWGKTLWIILNHYDNYNHHYDFIFPNESLL